MKLVKHFIHEPKASTLATNHPTYLFLLFLWHVEEAGRSTSPGTLIETKSNLRRKNFHRTNQESNFLGGSFSNRGNVRDQSILEGKEMPNILIDDFPSRTDPSIFTSIATELLVWSHKTTFFFPALKTIRHFLPQSAMSYRWD